MWPWQHMNSLSVPVSGGAARPPLLLPGPMLHTCHGGLLTPAGLLQAEAHANLANALQQLGNFDMAVIYYQVRFLALHSPSQLWHRLRQAATLLMWA